MSRRHQICNRVVLFPGGFVANITVDEEQVWDRFAFKHSRFSSYMDTQAELIVTQALVQGGDLNSAQKFKSLISQGQDLHREWHDIGAKWYAELVDGDKARAAAHLQAMKEDAADRSI